MLVLYKVIVILFIFIEVLVKKNTDSKISHKLWKNDSFIDKMFVGTTKFE